MIKGFIFTVCKIASSLCSSQRQKQGVIANERSERGNLTERERIDRPALIRLCFSALFVLLFIILILILFRRYPQLPLILTNPQEIRAFVSQFGLRAPLVFIALQVVQIIVAPLPGYIVELVAGYIFGAWHGTIYCMLGILIGSSLAFSIGRLFGRNLLQTFINKEKMQRFDDYVVHKGPFIIFLLLLFSLLGDFTYYLAGLTPIPYLIFIFMVLIARLPTNIAYNLVGSKAFSLSLAQWLILIGILLLLAGLFYRFRHQIEKIIIRLTKKS